MPSNHLILCCPLLLLPPIPLSIRVFSNESTLRMRWPKYWSFSFSISPSNEHPGLISFRMDWLDLLAVQGTLKSLLQHYTSKASVLRRSAFFTVQLSHPYMTTRKTIALTRWTFVGKIMSLLLNVLSRLVITFFPRKKCPLISWLQSPSAVILEPPKIKSDTVSPSTSHELMGPDAMTECGLLEKGMANHFSILALRTPHIYQYSWLTDGFKVFFFLTGTYKFHPPPKKGKTYDNNDKLRTHTKEKRRKQKSSTILPSRDITELLLFLSCFPLCLYDFLKIMIIYNCMCCSKNSKF